MTRTFYFGLQADIDAIATDEGFKFLYSLEAGEKGEDILWLKQDVIILASFENFSFSAIFQFEFTFGKEQLEELIPELKVKTELKLEGNVESKFQIYAKLKFDYNNKTWNHELGKIEINLSQAPTFFQFLDRAYHEVLNEFITYLKNVVLEAGKSCACTTAAVHLGFPLQPPHQ